MNVVATNAICVICLLNLMYSYGSFTSRVGMEFDR